MATIIEIIDPATGKSTLRQTITGPEVKEFSLIKKNPSQDLKWGEFSKTNSTLTLTFKPETKEALQQAVKEAELGAIDDLVSFAIEAGFEGVYIMRKEYYEYVSGLCHKHHGMSLTQYFKKNNAGVKGIRILENNHQTEVE